MVRRTYGNLEEAESLRFREPVLKGGSGKEQKQIMRDDGVSRQAFFLSFYQVVIIFSYSLLFIWTGFGFGIFCWRDLCFFKALLSRFSAWRCWIPMSYAVYLFIFSMAISFSHFFCSLRGPHLACPGVFFFEAGGRDGSDGARIARHRCHYHQAINCVR